MSESQFQLFRSRRFAALFVTQFLGAMNDNLFKNALVILVLYRVAETAGVDGRILITIAAGVFIIPFFLFSATAGQIADKLEKANLIRFIKLAEIVIMGLAVLAFTLGDPYVMLGVLFLMGTQSALFGPVKYGILPDLLREDELIGGNALIEAGTFLAILIGTIAGGVIILTAQGVATVSALIVGIALLGWGASLFIPRVAAASPNLKIDPNIVAATWSIMRAAAARRDILLSILGISWFWLAGATYLSQFPNFAKDVIGADEQVVTLFLVAFSVGIGLGSLLCNWLLGGEISAKYAPFGALGMTLFTLDLYFASRGLAPPGPALISLADFLAEPWNWRILADLVATSVSAGVFVVPLYAILQSRSDESRRSRTIAANNILNALFMVIGAVAATAMLAAGWPIPSIFLAVAIANGVVAIYVCGLLPDAIVKALLGSLLRLLYGVEVKGLDNVRAAGKRAVIVVNHVSFLDPVLLAVLLPEKPTFAVNTAIARRWWIRPFLTLVDAFPMDPANPMSMKALIKAVREDRHCVIFPEGRITVTGALMKIYEGPGMIADKADAMLVPVRIDGAQYSPFSRLKGKLRIRWFPKITVTILPPRRFELPDGLPGRVRRRMAGLKHYDVMTNLIFETSDRRTTLFEALLEARALHGGDALAAEDAERRPMSYDRLVRGALALGGKLAGLAEPGAHVGVLLPNSLAAVTTFFALQARGRVPAMLNNSAGLANMTAACRAAEIATVLTSRRFVEAAKLDDVVGALGADIVYLEDLGAGIGPMDKLAAMIGGRFPSLARGARPSDPDSAAVVLFTSGSEGTPKGVVLSHANLLANRYQLAARIDFNPTDIVFNALPMFHSFGLTGGVLLPVLSGIKTFLYPSPLHYRIVPALVYDSNATIMFGTDTFLTGYARAAHAYDFYSLRYVFAGAERVKDETRRVWAEQFGLRILEGYGATETAPALSSNTPMHYKAGTVGRFLPGIDYRLEPVPGIDEGGRLIVSGPNLMMGYLRAEAPGVLEPLADGEYDTGDIVAIDGEGFVTIVGRAKRFAKIAGEMVSLGAAEDHAAALWPDHAHAVVAIADERKGESLVLVTDNRDASRAELMAFAQSRGAAELMVPRTIHTVDAVPLLGTGKIDYVGVAALVEALAE